MRFVNGLRACGLAAAILVAPIMVAVPATAYAQAAQNGAWETDAGDFVEIKGGKFDLAVTDSNGTAIFSQGRVTGRAPAADGGTDVTLKPEVIGGARKGAYAALVLRISADGASAELFDATGGQQRSMLKLVK